LFEIKKMKQHKNNDFLYKQCILRNQENRKKKSIKRENCSQYIIYKKIIQTK